MGLICHLGEGFLRSSKDRKNLPQQTLNRRLGWPRRKLRIGGVEDLQSFETRLNLEDVRDKRVPDSAMLPKFEASSKTVSQKLSDEGTLK